MAIFQFIEGWYNPGRRHSAPDYQSPIIDRKRACDGVRIPKSNPYGQERVLSFLDPPSSAIIRASSRLHLGNVD